MKLSDLEAEYAPKAAEQAVARGSVAPRAATTGPRRRVRYIGAPPAPATPIEARDELADKVAELAEAWGLKRKGRR